MNNKFTYLYWNRLLSDAHVKYLLKVVNEQKFRKGKVLDSEVAEDIRMSNVAFTEFNSETSPGLRLLSLETYRIALLANSYYNFDLYENSHTTQITKYSGKDSKYNWHNDSSPLFVEDNTNYNRKISVSIVLKEADKGGLFEIMDMEEGFDNKAGSAIAFPSYVEHRVTPVIKGERISIVSWTCGPEWR